MTLTSTHYRKLIQFLWMSSIAAEYNVELLVSEHVSDWCCYLYQSSVSVTLFGALEGVVLRSL